MQITEQERYIASLDRAQSGIDLSFLRGRCVLVAGAAGMLGSCVVDLLRRYGQCRVIAMGRNAAAMEARFGPADDTYSFYRQDVSAPVAGFCEDVDYIVHAASNADPVRMAEDPVGTLMANVLGTRNLLDYGLTHKMKRFLFVSSGEVWPAERRAGRFYRRLLRPAGFVPSKKQLSRGKAGGRSSVSELHQSVWRRWGGGAALSPVWSHHDPKRQPGGLRISLERS